MNYEEAKKPEDDNVLFMYGQDDDENEKFSDGSVVWYPV
jgi:hypothetical protein